MGSNNTIKIADTEVSMEDIFKRPEYVKQLKQLEEITTEVVKQQVDKINSKFVYINLYTYDIIRRYSSYYSIQYSNESNTVEIFMGLKIALVSMQDKNNNILIQVI